MQISRRHLLRSAGVLGGATALTGLTGLTTPGAFSAGAVAGSPALARAARITTRQVVLHRGPAGPGGWRPVVAKPGEEHVVRIGLGARPGPGRARRRTPLLAFAQMSDVHICDSESPMRLEYAEAFSSSAYRPQEILTAHIAESMVRQINRVGVGPVTGEPLAFALQTGDNSDNAQYNEVRWNIDLLDGGRTITPDSGDLTRYEGVMDSSDPAYYFTQYWHPEGTPEGLPDDEPRSKYGFPEVPGLLDAARRPFEGTGLAMEWYSALGNHDHLVQGNAAPDDLSDRTATGTSKEILAAKRRTVTADPDRRELRTTAELVAEHFTTTGLPVGHGFTDANRADGTAYYTFDKGVVRFVVLDSNNANGGDDGSLSRSQFQWLQDTLAAARHKLVVVASHHPSWSMVNGVVGDVDPQPRVLGARVVAELLRHENVVAWVNGHTHSNNVVAHRRRDGGGFWEINTASHIDWPQQARLVELVDNRDGTLSIFATMIDHAAPTAWDGSLDDPLQLAALARELAANDWQERDNHRRGGRKDRNVELLTPAPAFLR